MRTLGERPAHGYLTVIRNAGQLLQQEPGDVPTFLRQLEDIGQHWANSFALPDDWGGGEVPFNTVLVRTGSVPDDRSDTVRPEN